MSMVPYGLLALAPLLIFILPFWVPTSPARTISASLLAGFNNELSILSAVALSVTMLLVTWWSYRGEPKTSFGENSCRKLPRRLIGAVIAGTGAIQILAGWLITASHQRNLGDAGYVIEQATVRADTGRALYTQIEFAYGPLLVLPEVWMSRLLHCSISSAYFGLLVVESALGLLMLAFFLNSLPIREDLRRAAFILLAISAITPHFGVNYTFFRFVSPFAVLLWGVRARSPWRCALLLAAGEAFELLVSPELGLALAAGVLIFGLLRTFQSGLRWLAVALLPLGVLAGLLLTLGRPFLRMAAMFSQGAQNLPVGPYPHILLLLAASLWFVPRALGRSLNLSNEGSASLLGLYAVSIAFIPAALGRCDPLHVMFNGTGIWVLSCLAFTDSTQIIRKAWIACLCFVVLWDQRVNDRLFRYQDAVLVRKAVLQHLPPTVQDDVARWIRPENAYVGYLLSRDAEPERPVILTELKKFVGTSPVATPMEISPTVELQLRQAHLYSPGFFAFWTDTMNRQTEQRIVDFADTHRWMLLPAWWQGGYLQMPGNTGLFQGLNLHYKQRKPTLYCPGALFNDDLESNWRVAWSFGSYILYEHTGHSEPNSAEDIASCLSKQ